MSLKYEVDSLDGVEENLQALYSEVDGKYRLSVEDLPKGEDVSGLKSALEKERQARREAKERAEKAEQAAQDAAAEKARKDGDVEALEKSWQKKLDEIQNKAKEEADNYLGILKNNTVHATAIELATQLAVPGSAKALLPALEGRLSMEFRDGKAVPVVLDADGKPSALTVQELAKEVASDPAYAPIIAATKASGGGAAGAKGGGAASKGKAVYEMTTPEKSAFITENGFAAWQKKVQGEASKRT